MLPKEFSKKNSRAVDLSFIIKRAEGDNEYLKEIFESYLTEMPIYLQEFNQFVTKNNWPQIRKQAHKMKSPIALVGAHRLKKLFDIAESDSTLETRPHEALVIFEEINHLCLKTIEEIAKELKTFS